MISKVVKGRLCSTAWEATERLSGHLAGGKYGARVKGENNAFFHDTVRVRKIIAPMNWSWVVAELQQRGPGVCGLRFY